MSYVLQLKGKLQELKMKKMELATRINAKMNAIKNILATSAITPIEDIDLEGVRSLAREADEQKKEYLKTIEEIRKIEKELGG